MKASDVIAWFGAWSFFMTLLWCLLAAYQWASSRRMIDRDTLRDASHKAHCRIDDLDARCIKAEEQLKAAPTHEDLARVTDMVHRIGGDVRNIQGEISGINASTVRIEHALDILTEHHIRESAP